MLTRFAGQAQDTGFFFPTVNCVDRHMKADPDRCALIWEKDEPGDVERVTYR